MENGGFFDGRIRTGAGMHAVKELNRKSKCNCKKRRRRNG
ncbi:hypothetical protein HMPREF1548_03003 [Clostridium sp. KLE 1755]|nr:hypothetical protein HMPREF1548_03003 [Clostridium sp. KLE 1755]